MIAKADLHIHTVHSDGSDTIPALLNNIRQAGIDLFSLTDHDTLNGTLAILSTPDLPAAFLPGIEFSCAGGAGKCHILGYGFDPTHPALLSLVKEGLDRRKKKLLIRLSHLKRSHGIVFSPTEEDWLFSLNAAGKPHLASLLIANGYASDKQEAIDRFLSHIPGGGERTDARDAIDAIHRAGGVALLAHPLGGEGEARLSEAAFQDKLSRLLPMGIDGLECAYSLYTRAERERLTSTAQHHSLLISGGSDYHGTNKTIPLGRLSSDNSDPPASSLTLLHRFGLL
ncbi:MAG: PHP domain-containing protein [Ruminococcaceae bacterium]|nr:PHP domain-containing protein [Oscillospiraceae bacterium]